MVTSGANCDVQTQPSQTFTSFTRLVIDDHLMALYGTREEKAAVQHCFKTSDKNRPMTSELDNQSIDCLDVTVPLLQEHIVDLHGGLHSSSGFHQKRLKDSWTQEEFVDFCTDRQQASTSYLKACMLTCFNLLKQSFCSEQFPKLWDRDILGCEYAFHCLRVMLQPGQEVRFSQIGCTSLSLGGRTIRDWLVSLERYCNTPPPI